LFASHARDAGVADPDALAAQLVVLYDGATMGARMDRDPGAADAARTVAAAVIASAIPQPKTGGDSSSAR
jgi:hypothetical protein